VLEILELFLFFLPPHDSQFSPGVRFLILTSVLCFFTVAFLSQDWSCWLVEGDPTAMITFSLVFWTAENSVRDGAVLY